MAYRGLGVASHGKQLSRKPFSAGLHAVAHCRGHNQCGAPGLTHVNATLGLFAYVLNAVRKENTMMTGKRTRSNIALAVVAGMGALFVTDNFSATAPSTFLSKAEARVGRPMTPGSVAGVARRTTRRAVVGGAAVYGAQRYYGGACGYYPYPACY
jgi:hypothetical protein